MQSIDLSLLNENQKIAAKRAIQTALRIGVVPIKFQKADQSVRHMMATLNPSVLDQFSVEHASGKNGEENVDVVHVFDFDKKDWRAFRMDRLMEVGSISARDLISPVTKSL